jgi:hypothetical protein
VDREDHGAHLFMCETLHLPYDQVCCETIQSRGTFILFMLFN